MKKIVSLLVLCTSTLFAQIPTNGLAVSYPFSGNSNDMSGNNNNLTPFNGPTLTFDRFNNANSAYLFDGVNDYFTAVAPGPMHKKSRSVSFWAKTTAPYNGNGYTVLHYGNPTGSGTRFEVGLNSSCNGLYVDIGNGYGTKTYTTTDNLWHMYTLVYDSIPSTQLSSVTYFVDAVLINSICSSYNTTQVINTQYQDPINIGRFYTGIPRYFNGCIDDIYAYDRPLTPAEVVTIYTTVACTSAPNSPGSIIGNQTICSGNPLTYSVAPVSGASSYSWNLPGGWTGSSVTNSINITAGSGSGNISISAINSCGQSSPVNLNITVNPSPTVTVTANSTVICKGNSTSLFANGANSYTWSIGPITNSIMISPTVTTSYNVTGSNGFGCLNTAVKTISVTNFPLPTISATGPGTSCVGQNISLASNGALTYTWEPGSLNGFLVNVSPTSTTNYTITGIDNNGCYNTTLYTQVVIGCLAGIHQNNIDPSLFAIFPNPTSGYLEIKSPITVDQIEIYSTLGKLVYSEKTNSTKKQFDLTELSNGVYFVYLRSADQTIIKKLTKN